MRILTKTQKSINNIIISVSSQIVYLLIGFIARSIFIKNLGIDYLGINGLFSNILSLLSLAELGLGNAIIFYMYKPLVNDDKDKLNSLIRLYSRAYKFIGLTISIIGILLVPFIDIIAKGNYNITNIKLLYILYLCSTVVSYFFAYNRSIIVADQKKYIDVLNKNIFFIILNILQIYVLIKYKNYVMFLVLQIIFNLLENIFISIIAHKLYPFLKDKNKKDLDKYEKKNIYKNILAMASHRIGSVIVNGTDNILISYFVGVYWVGLYSNYVMIISAINGILGQIFTAVTASIGHINAENDIERSYNVFKITFFLNFWLYGVCSVCLLVLINPFIEIWIGKENIIEMYIVLLIIINFYIRGMRTIVLVFRDTKGLFWDDRYKPILESIINLIASIILLKIYGIVGVLIGTFISTMTTSFWIEPYILYKKGFKKPVKQFFIKYIEYTIILIIISIIVFCISYYIRSDNIVMFICKSILTFIITNILFAIFFFKSNEFKSSFKIFKAIFKK